MARARRLVSRIVAQVQQRPYKSKMRSLAPFARNACLCISPGQLRYNRFEREPITRRASPFQAEQAPFFVLNLFESYEIEAELR